MGPRRRFVGCHAGFLRCALRQCRPLPRVSNDLKSPGVAMCSDVVRGKNVPVRRHSLSSDPKSVLDKPQVLSPSLDASGESTVKRGLKRIDEADLQAALTGDPQAVTQLVRALAPYVQARVVKVFAGTIGVAASGSWRAEIEDQVQETFAVLFQNGAALLRTWSADKGASLEGFVGLVAERRAISALRTRRVKELFRQDSLDRDGQPELPGAADATNPERLVGSRETLRRFYNHLHRVLSPLAFEMFQRLFLYEQSVDQVATEKDMKPDAVYAWRSRLARRLKEERVRLSVEVDAPELETPQGDGFVAGLSPRGPGTAGQARQGRS